MRDTRSTDIKRKLKAVFPDRDFKVKIDKYAGGESINIYTDLLDDSFYNELQELDWRNQVRRDLNGKEMDRLRELESSRDSQNLTRQKIRDIVSNFEHIDKDQFGDILAGGNTYLFITPLRRVQK